MLGGARGPQDHLIGGGGNDRLNGGEGDGDLLEPGIGSDSLNGGPGVGDIVVYRRAAEPVICVRWRKAGKRA